MARSQYRLSNNRKCEIAQNLIDVLQKDTIPSEHTVIFIDNWIRRIDLNGERKVFLDVWDIVLKNYLPTTRPVLFRACGRTSGHGKIASFTGRFESARKFSGGKGSLLICDTKASLIFDQELSKPGQYRHSFYPLTEVLIRAKASGGWGFSKRLLEDYSDEDEYIMRIHLGECHSFRWK